MRTYPRNSPEAAARIVALAMLADGHLCKAELDAVTRLDGAEQIGLDPTRFSAVMHTFCEDLLVGAHGSWPDACRIDSHTLSSLLAEIDDAALRRKVLQLCATVVEADGHVADGESLVMCAAVEQWGLHREMFGADLPSR
jgi:hypothetical protein